MPLGDGGKGLKSWAKSRKTASDETAIELRAASNKLFNAKAAFKKKFIDEKALAVAQAEYERAEKAHERAGG